MARIKLGSIVTDISGSVGSATFQRTRYGMIMRNKPIPPSSRTELQYNVRQKIISLQNSWQALTADQRRQWERFMDFSGQTIRRSASVLLSGQALYLKYQIFRLLYDQSLLTTLAYVPVPSHPNYLRVRQAGGVWSIQFDAAVNPTTVFYICKISNARNENQAFSWKGLRFMKVAWALDDEPTINDPYLAAFGAFPPTDAWIHYAVQYFSTTSPVFSGWFTGSSQIHTT